MIRVAAQDVEREAVLREPQVRVTHVAGEVAVVSLLGEHDLATAWEVRNAVAFALERGAHLVVDLSETEFIDSSIIHVLFESEQLASGHGRRVSLQLQADADVRGVLEINGLLEELPVYCTRAEAIDAVRKAPDWVTERSAVGIGSRSNMERREKWRCSWL